MHSAPPTRGDTVRGGPRSCYRGCSGGSGPAATPCAGLGAPRFPQERPGGSQRRPWPAGRGRVWGIPLCKRLGGTRSCAASLGARAKQTGEEGTSHREAPAAARDHLRVPFLICPPCLAVTAIPVGLPSSHRALPPQAGEWLRHWAAVGSLGVGVQIRVPPWMPPGGIPTPSQSPHRPSRELFHSESHQLQQKAG